MKDNNNGSNYNMADFGLPADYANGEYKDTTKFLISKNDAELFDEAKAIPGKIVRIKRMGSVAKNERWRIFEDDTLRFVIDGEKLSKREKVFLRTVEGVIFLIQEFKIGFKSVNELRNRIKEKI